MSLTSLEMPAAAALLTALTSQLLHLLHLRLHKAQAAASMHHSITHSCSRLALKCWSLLQQPAAAVRSTRGSAHAYQSNLALEYLTRMHRTCSSPQLLGSSKLIQAAVQRLPLLLIHKGSSHTLAGQLEQLQLCTRSMRQLRLAALRVQGSHHAQAIH